MINTAEFLDRRNFLSHTASGLGSVALASLLSRDGLLGAQRESAPGKVPVRPAINSGRPHAARDPHFQPRAKQVLMIFCSGAISQVDTFDYKPEIAKHAGQRPKVVDRKTLRNTKNGLMPSPFGFKQYGQTGKWVSDIFPHTGQCADDICFIHSMHTNIPSHEFATVMMNTGAGRMVKPSMGSWMLYGLGTENQNLPGYIVLGSGLGGAKNWRSAFLPGAFQGALIPRAEANVERTIANIKNYSYNLKEQREQLDLLKTLNQQHQAKLQEEADLEARIQSFELAFKMQSSVPEVVDVAGESKETLDLYGPDVTKPGSYTANCLLARRLADRASGAWYMTGAGKNPPDGTGA